MSTKGKVVCVLLWSLLLLACQPKEYQRAPIPGFGIGTVPEEDKRDEDEIAFYEAVSQVSRGQGKNQDSLEELEKILRAGHSPDYIIPPPWGIPWHDNSPLWFLCYYYEPLKMLIQYGADVNNRPYVAKTLLNHIISEKYPDETMLQYSGTSYEEDIYKLVKLFLEAGADPNIKGGTVGVLPISTDRHYLNYYEKNGTLPINYAIEKNLFSIVDVLLEYGAVLDNESLDCAKEAAKRSGSTEMEDYIKAVWEKQQIEK